MATLALAFAEAGAMVARADPKLVEIVRCRFASACPRSLCDARGAAVGAALAVAGFPGGSASSS